MNQTLKYSLVAICALGGSTLTAQENDKPRINALQHTLQKRPKTGRLDSTRFADHTFLSVGAGPELMLYENNTFSGHRWGAAGNVSFGKWFDAVQGGRISLDAGFLGRTQTDSILGRSMRVGMMADYLINMSALGWGYDPGRRFELIWFAGVGGNYSMLRENEGFAWAARTGFQARLRLSRMTSIYLEPRVTFYGDKIDHTSNWRKYNLAPSLMAGVSYQMIPLAERLKDPEFLKGTFFENTFFTVGGGMQTLIANRMARDNWWRSTGASFLFGMGKWFTPASGIRLSGQGGSLPWIHAAEEDARLKMMSVSLD